MRDHPQRSLGDPVADPDAIADETPEDLVALQRAQIAARMPAFAGARLAASLVGPYDITPDWNPVLGPAPGLPGLYLAYGFSGHGFKMAPAIGRCVAQSLRGCAAVGRLRRRVDLLAARGVLEAAADPEHPHFPMD
ncbi:NAD(P)/FAD-dependent oxidoreductase [Candidatus Palauibacter sp.]|uniref:NAD(P)/FAD-dependent oxidoreductase n=1 Tax=Candidatus Palauibacter sp. TaxID=3101350 RepID=UPI003B5CA79E